MEPGEAWPGENVQWQEEDWLEIFVSEGDTAVKMWTYRYKAATA